MAGLNQEKLRTHKSTWQRPTTFKVKKRVEKNNSVLWNISVIPKTGHSGQAEHLAWVQESVCHLPDQIVVKGNSHMNVIHAQALIIWERSVVWQHGLWLCPKRVQLTLWRRGEERRGCINVQWSQTVLRVLLSKARCFQEHFKSHSNTTKYQGEGGCPAGANGGRASGERGWLAEVATLIRIHFQPGPWNSFVPVTGLRFPLALIPGLPHTQ